MLNLRYALLPIAFCGLFLSAKAQAPDWTKAGHLMEQDGKLRRTSAVLALTGATLVGYTLLTSDPAFFKPVRIAGAALIFPTICINFSAATKSRNAGRLLQAR
jgi:hypothetical protein